jgi:hypothetical protein
VKPSLQHWVLERQEGFLWTKPGAVLQV